MFCSKCGQENQEGSAFCNACGASLQGDPTPAPTSEVTLTRSARVRSGAILALISSILSAILTFILCISVNNGGTLFPILLALFICSSVFSGLALSNANAAKVHTIITVVLVFLSIPLLLIGYIAGIGSGAACIFLPVLTLSTILLVVGSIKAVIAAFAYGKK